MMENLSGSPILIIIIKGGCSQVFQEFMKYEPSVPFSNNNKEVVQWNPHISSGRQICKTPKLPIEAPRIYSKMLMQQYIQFLQKEALQSTPKSYKQLPDKDYNLVPTVPCSLIQTGIGLCVFSGT